VNAVTNLGFSFSLLRAVKCYISAQYNLTKFLDHCQKRTKGERFLLLASTFSDTTLIRSIA